MHRRAYYGFTNLPSDYSVTPDKQADQVMAIWPIVDGQKAVKEATPPRSAAPRSEENLLSMGNDDPPKESQTNNSQAAAGQDDLVDFGQNDQAAKPAAPKTQQAPAGSGSDEIASLLNSTGKPAEGPLVDFTQEMKSGLPSGKPQPSEDLLG